ncbi:glycoside hydrolase superfamily [Immersiella caudata]|uniref:glucan endo-1,3-beta-D-glucosidase n=1 Tax=Immersiella caudata TaxID=314043 RepID=A0AA39XG00_9PEZI|nr:glycoside hydrolase superfamily [Immersiella caudata]
MGERQPLDQTNQYAPRQQHYQPNYDQRYAPRSQQHYQEEPYVTAPPRGSPPRAGPGSHPDSAFGRLRAQRRLSQDGPSNGGRAAGPYAAAGVAAPSSYRPQEMRPQSPAHRDVDGRQWGREQGYPPAPQRRPTQSNVTPGADNFSQAAAGGMAGIAMSVAEHNARESGLNAIRGPDYPQQAYQQQGQWVNHGQGQAGVRVHPDYSQSQPPYGQSYGAERDSSSSLQNLAAVPRSPGRATPGQRTPSRSPQHSFANDIYTDDPYQNLSRPQDPRLGVVDPHAIEDDGDDGIGYHLRGKRSSMLSLGSSHRGREGAAVAGAAGAAGGVLGAFAARNASGSGLSSQYAPVHGSATAYEGHGPSNLSAEKTGWKTNGGSSSRGKKWRLAIIGIVALLIIVGVVLGILFGVVFKNKDGGSAGGGGGKSAAEDNLTDLGINSDEINQLMNNPNLHKVFPGIDYTPLNTQYPECIHDPPSQNNVTRDIAVLSQLTNTLRMYGTDCNQTQMVIHAIERLQLTGKMKVWLGVWQDGNTTTNARQLAQMYDILDEYKDTHFKGVVVANEILFREEMDITTLGSLLGRVRTNLTALGYNLPVATSDLGDKWTASLAAQSDYIMANIHPFFGGINANDASSWTWTFWHNQAKSFFKSDPKKNIISETGWPSQGGTHCGQSGITVCPNAAVAGVPQMNQFMEDWVCDAMKNGTEYFWFESFDEPWKVRFNSGNQNWEDQWGLMDVNRNLKKGVKIPDCGGKTIDG